MAFVPLSPYNTFFKGSIIEPTTISGNTLVVDKNVELVWPSLCSEDSIPLNRIMNISVIGDFNVYLPKPNQSSAFSDALIINLGPFPLKLCNYDGTLLKRITGTPSFTYALLKSPVTYGDPFFNVEQNTSALPQIVSFTSPVAADSLLLIGRTKIGNDIVKITEQLKLKAGTVRTKEKYISFDTILNVSNVNLTGVTAEILPVKGAEKFLYVGTGSISNPVGIDLPIFNTNPAADLKQTLDPKRDGAVLTLTYSITTAGSAVTFVVAGYVNNVITTANIMTTTTVGTFTATTTTKFSSVITFYRSSGTAIVSNVSLVYPATTTQSAFKIVNVPGSVTNGQYLPTQYQPNITPRKLQLTYTVPKNSAAGSFEIVGLNAITGQKVTENIATAVTSTTQTTQTINTANYFSIVTSLKNTSATTTFEDVSLTYPSNNNYPAITIIAETSVLVASSPAVVENNPELTPYTIEISGIAGTEVTAIGITIKGTDSTGPVSFDMQLTPEIPGSLAYKGKSLLQLITITSLTNNSHVTLTNFIIKGIEIDADAHFYHVTEGSPLYLNERNNSLDNMPVTNGTKWRQFPEMDPDAHSDPQATIDFSQEKREDASSGTKPLFGTNLALVAKINTYTTPQKIEIQQTININNAPKNNIGSIGATSGRFLSFASDNGYVMFAKITMKGTYSTTVYDEWLKGSPNAVINYPLPFLPLTKYILYSSSGIKVQITGMSSPLNSDAAATSTAEIISIKAGQYISTSNYFYTLDKVEIMVGSSNDLSILSPACSFLGNLYPDFFVFRPQNVQNGKTYNVNMYNSYLLKMPGLFNSGNNDIYVTGYDKTFKKQSTTLSRYQGNQYIDWFFITEISNQKTTAIESCLSYAPNTDSCYALSPGYSKDGYWRSPVLNNYSKYTTLDPNKKAELNKLPPPHASILEIRCTRITSTGGSLAPTSATIYLKGTNNPAIFSENIFISENIQINTSGWTRTKNQYLYLLSVSTYVPISEQTPTVEPVIIEGLEIRTVYDSHQSEYIYNNSSIFPGQSTFYVQNNPSSNQGPQTLTVHANNGAQLKINGQSDGVRFSEIVVIGPSREQKTLHQYNHLDSINNASSKNTIENCYIIGNEIASVQEVVFLDNESAMAIQNVPLNGNPPTTYPPKNLIIQSPAQNNANNDDAKMDLYIEGVDGDGVKIFEFVSIEDSHASGGVETQYEYASVSKILNTTGVTLPDGFSVKAPEIEGVAYYIYTTSNESEDSAWNWITFGAFLSEEKGKSLAGNGLFFEHTSLNEDVKVVIVDITKDTDNDNNYPILYTKNTKLLVCTGDARAGSTTVNWILPESSATESDGVFFYLFNPSGSSVNILLKTRGNDCFNCNASVKTFGLNIGQSALLVCIKNNGWAVICGNTDKSAQPIDATFPVYETSDNVTADLFNNGTIKNTNIINVI